MRALLGLAVSAAVASTLVASPAAWAVSSADEVCAPSADPCMISSTVSIDDGAVLDFGLREVLVVSGGQIQTTAGSASILCGSFSASGGTTAAILARGPAGDGIIDGAFFSIDARRVCSLEPTRKCLSARNCQFGACTRMACSENLSRTCLQATDCQLGTCNPNGRCSKTSSVFCATNADCDLGACSRKTCSLGTNRECSADNECDLGTCTGDTGDIRLDRNVRADGNEPGAILLRGAGSIVINATINADSSNVENDGGSIEIEAGVGDLEVNNTIKAGGGAFSQGGEVCLLAGRDVSIAGLVDVDGGDFDGGFIEIDAGRDAIIANSLRASSAAGEGFGGEISLLSGRDTILTGNNQHRTNGHMSFENFGGDGGSQDYFAGRDIVMSQDVTMEANGAQPDGYGEAISLLADAAISIDGDIRAKSSGVFGGGGSIELTADGPIYVGPTSSMDVTGISGGGGDIDVIGESSTELRGTVDVSASGGGYGGAIYVTTRTGLDISGSLVTNGTESNGSNGSLDVEGCDVTVTGTGVLDNGGELGDNLVTAGRDITIATGGQILATLSGTNTFIHRDAANPPVINGTVTPAPTIIVSPGLSTCSQCGDGVVQSSETCDDGNTVGGDGCSADCQDEGCIAETTGYPAVPLCDDAKVCTTDACVDGACTHTVACDDGIDCTFDACNGVGSCVHTPTNSLCDDGNACTTDACSAADGCTWTFLSSACDDGLECTSNDICSFGLCAGTVNCPGGLACNGDTGICETTTTTTTSTTTTTTTTLDTTTTTSTSTSTTTTTLMGQVCGNAAVEGSETCDDGDTDWSQGLYCDATCNELACADTDDNTTVTATDALFILRVAVSLATCDACVCDTDGSGTTTAGDSLRALRRAVGVSIALLCPVCPT